MYLSAWVLLVVISIAISLAAFAWAVRSGQFSDPDRARYLPLSSASLAPPVKNPDRLTREVYALMLIGAMGLVILSIAVILSLCHSSG